MTKAEARREAKRRWGPTGFAGRSSSATRRNLRFVVGVLGGSGTPHVLGTGDSFEAAFALADKVGFKAGDDRVARAVVAAESAVGRAPSKGSLHEAALAILEAAR